MAAPQSLTTSTVSPSARRAESDRGLAVLGLSREFGGVQALRSISLRLADGEIVGLIGPNGSGKTTLLNCISALVRPTSGAVTLDGISTRGWHVHEVASAGVIRTFQNIRLYQQMTVLQNIQVSALAGGKVRRGRASAVARALLVELSILHLEPLYAGNLSYGDQRRVEIARALGANPRFLLLDEPAAGMNEAESDELGQAIQRIRAERGCGVLIVEHDLRLIMEHCDYTYVLNEGVVISSGTPETVRKDPAVVTAYIGESEDGGKA